MWKDKADRWSSRRTNFKESVVEERGIKMGKIYVIGNTEEDLKRAQVDLMGAGHSKDSIVNRAYIDKLVGKTDARNDMAIRLAAMGTCNTVYVANGWDADKLCLVEHQYAAAMNYLAIYEGDMGTSSVKEKKGERIQNSFNENFARLAQLKSEGKLMVLKCVPKQVMWVVDSFGGTVYEVKVTSAELQDDGNVHYKYEAQNGVKFGGTDSFTDEEIGKKVFYDEKEAKNFI